jgi:hypothetical protein
MFVVASVAFLLPACMQRHILQMSSPEQATTVTLFDAGEDAGANDDGIVVLDGPARIVKVAAFFKKRMDKWKPYSGRVDTARRYQISFRKGDEVTDRFWIVDGALFLHTPSGKYFSCDLTDDERTQLLALFADSKRPAVETSRL